MAAHRVGVGWSGEFVGPSLGPGAGHQGFDTKIVSRASKSASPAGGLGFGVSMSRTSERMGADSSHSGAGLSCTLREMDFSVSGGKNKSDGMDNKSGVSNSASYSLGAGAMFWIGAGSSKVVDASSNIFGSVTLKLRSFVRHQQPGAARFLPETIRDCNWG